MESYWAKRVEHLTIIGDEGLRTMAMTNVAEGKAQLSALIDQALAGGDVVISKHGKPLVRLVPYERDTRPRDLSVRVWTGEVRVAEDFDELPADWLAEFEGRRG